MYQPDLFASSPEPQDYDLPDGDVVLYASAFSASDSDRLLTLLQDETQWQQDHIKLYGKQIPLPRLTAWYGDPGRAYTYSGIAMTPRPWTPVLLEIKERVEGLAEIRFNSVLLNFYRTGQDSVSWHADDEPELAPCQTIASVSFGGTRRFVMKHKHRTDLPKWEVPLTHGSVLLMRGETQQHWLHHVPRTAKPAEPRINLTFRVIQ